ncbi:MAG: hypothetical protein II937_14780 [Bacteroidales bacterium]|nr:hypothetical protein [Bacteroidales bacterium]
MKRLRNIILGLAISTLLPIAAQAQNCADFLSFRKAEKPWRYNTASKSATCFSGKKYEFVLPLTKGNEYRLQFFASPVFNNEVQVKIVDLNSNQTIIDLPGKLDEGNEPKKGMTCLQDYLNDKNQYVHPFFDFAPAQSTSVKIMIEIKNSVKYIEEYTYDDYGNMTGTVKKEVPQEGGPEVVKGCFTVYVIDKVSDVYDFN